MEEHTNNEEALAGEQGSPSSDGQSDGNGSISLEEMNTILGRDFKDKDTALKSVKDTFGFVGKAGSYNASMKKLTAELGMNEDSILSTLKNMSENNTGQPQAKSDVPQVDPEKFISKDKYETDMFYSQNKGYEPYREILDSLSKSQGKPLAEVVESDTFKNLYSKTTGFDEIQSKRSVLESNPRLNSASDKLSTSIETANEARKAAQAGDTVAANAFHRDAKRNAVSAVRELYDIN